MFVGLDSITIKPKGRKKLGKKKDRSHPQPQFRARLDVVTLTPGFVGYKIC